MVGMTEIEGQNGSRFRDYDRLRKVLSAGDLALNIDVDRKNPLNIEIAVNLVQSVKIVNVAGDPIRVSRRRTEISYDDGAFLCVLFQKEGQTFSNSKNGQKIINPGDLMVWHGAYPIQFEMPNQFHKVCLIVPFETFERTLPEAKSFPGIHLKRDNVSRLLGTCLLTLAEEFVTGHLETIDSAAELTLDLVGSALSRQKESRAVKSRLNLFQRITAFIERRLEDTQLSPLAIAQAHHISIRYLYMVFSERGTTVGSWIRSRRLEKCRAELVKPGSDRSITEIATRFGFYDVAHFSRSFHAAFGMPPLKFRLAHRSPRSSRD
jgi:AraC-like DNA-binding protein